MKIYVVMADYDESNSLVKAYFSKELAEEFYRKCTDFANRFAVYSECGVLAMWEEICPAGDKHKHCPDFSVQEIEFVEASSVS